jgi:hypothetical protein
MSPVERLLREAPSPTITDSAALERVAAVLRAGRAERPRSKPRALDADLPTTTTQREVA